MNVTIDGTVTITGIDDRTAKAVYRRCAIPNPKHDAAVKYSPWGKTKVPEYLYLADLLPDNGIRVPRGFPFGEYSEFADVEVEDRRVEACVNWPEPIIEPYISQRYVISQIMDNRDDAQGTFLVVMPTSRGKTITMLVTLAMLKQRALVIVHTDLILNAWVNDFAKVFGGDSASVGIIKQNSFTIGEHLTVASMQTLIRRKDRWDDLWKQFGAVIVDECHISPCPTVMEILSACPTKYRFGITATDTRKDGMHEVLYLLLGKPFVRQSVEKTETQAAMQISDAKVITTGFYAEYGEDYNAFLEELTQDDQRNSLIVDEVMKEVKKDKVCLVVTNRRLHARELFIRLKEKGADADLLLGGGNRVEANAVVEQYLNGKKGVIVATNKLISTGANIPPLERLFITIPYANETEVLQLCGRIRRRFPGKKDAIVYFFYDSLISRVGVIFKKYVLPAFQKMHIPTWEGKYY